MKGWEPTYEEAGVLARHDPAGALLPVVFDSPHSGWDYPADFGHALPLNHLRSTEDRFVDQLFGAAPHYGASLLRALFPRSYIDANRHPLDLDEGLLAEPWPEPLQPGGKTRNGKGLIRSQAKGQPIYERKLTVPEVEARLEGYWEPYHAALEALLGERRSEFGAVWHLNCHSWTPPASGRNGHPVRHIDICLGDRDGTTCDPAFTAFAAETLQAMGYVVRVNRPFKGMELIKRHGRPATRSHSLQIEINRHLYLEPDSLEKSSACGELEDNLERFIAAVCDFVHSSL